MDPVHAAQERTLAPHISGLIPTPIPNPAVMPFNGASKPFRALGRWSWVCMVPG